MSQTVYLKLIIIIGYIVRVAEATGAVVAAFVVAVSVVSGVSLVVARTAGVVVVFCTIHSIIS